MRGRIRAPIAFKDINLDRERQECVNMQETDKGGRTNRLKVKEDARTTMHAHANTLTHAHMHADTNTHTSTQGQERERGEGGG